MRRRDATMRRRSSAGALIVALLALTPTGPLCGQRRPFEPIRPPVGRGEVLPAEEAPPPPAAEECEQAARRIAASYSVEEPDALAGWLAPEFPDRAELLATLHRLDLQVGGLELRIESLDAVRVSSWRRVPSPGGGETLLAECLVDLRLRLLFDGRDSGERVVRPAGRAQWRIALRAPLQEVPDARD